MQCLFSDKAEKDLEAIGDFIAADNPARALSFIQELRDHCRKLTQAPMRRVVDEIDGHAIRMAPHAAYNIYFVWLENAETVFITRILHSARDQ